MTSTRARRNAQNTAAAASFATLATAVSNVSDTACDESQYANLPALIADTLIKVDAAASHVEALGWAGVPLDETGRSYLASIRNALVAASVHAPYVADELTEAQMEAMNAVHTAEHTAKALAQDFERDMRREGLDAGLRELVAANID